MVHEQALASAERQGSPGARGRVLVDLAITAFRGGDVEAVRELRTRRERLLSGRGLPYVAAATALQAWVAWRDGQVEEALALGAEALELWESQPGVLPVLPGLLAAGRLAPRHWAHRGSGRRGAALARPVSARLPDELEAAVQAACESLGPCRPELAGRLLAGAVQLARDSATREDQATAAEREWSLRTAPGKPAKSQCSP